MTPAQCRAARGLLDWTQTTLADAAGVAVMTVTNFEKSWRVVTPETIQAILDRNWILQREEVKMKIQSGQCSDEEAMSLAAQFNSLKRRKQIEALS